MEAEDNGEQLLELLSKPEYYGKEELKSLYQSMHTLFYSDLRKDDGDLPAFRSRFELPPEALGFLFLKQAKISAESFSGDLKIDAVVDDLRRLKMKLLDSDEQTASKKRHIWIQESMEDSGHAGPDDGHSDRWGHGAHRTGPCRPGH